MKVLSRPARSSGRDDHRQKPGSGLAIARDPRHAGPRTSFPSAWPQSGRSKPQHAEPCAKDPRGISRTATRPAPAPTSSLDSCALSKLRIMSLPSGSLRCRAVCVWHGLEKASFHCARVIDKAGRAIDHHGLARRQQVSGFHSGSDQDCSARRLRPAGEGLAQHCRHGPRVLIGAGNQTRQSRCLPNTSGMSKPCCRARPFPAGAGCPSSTGRRRYRRRPVLRVLPLR